MKYLKRYFVFAIVLCSIFFVKFQFFRQDFARIEDFRGGELETTVWNPLVAADVNDREIKLVIDNKEYSSNDYQFYMNEDRNIMVPVSILRDALDCSAHVYDGVELLVEKGADVTFVDRFGKNALYYLDLCSNRDCPYYRHIISLLSE